MCGNPKPLNPQNPLKALFLRPAARESPVAARCVVAGSRPGRPLVKSLRVIPSRRGFRVRFRVEG